jgi:hypothetical protein
VWPNVKLRTNCLVNLTRSSPRSDTVSFVLDAPGETEKLKEMVNAAVKVGARGARPCPAAAGAGCGLGASVALAVAACGHAPPAPVWVQVRVRLYGCSRAHPQAIQEI